MADQSLPKTAKQCTKCGQVKPLESFPKRYGRNAHLPRENTCGYCKTKAHRQRHPETKQVETHRRRARDKGMSIEEYRAWQQERAERARLNQGWIVDGVKVKKNRRRKCPVLSDRRIDYLVNAEHYKAKSREYHANNPIKARERRHRRRNRFNEVFRDLTDAQWREVLERFNHRCAYCDRRVKLTIDHITPIAKGGAHTVANVVPACHRCNTRKRVGPPLRTVQPLLLA